MVTNARMASPKISQREIDARRDTSGGGADSRDGFFLYVEADQSSDPGRTEDDLRQQRPLRICEVPDA